MMVKTSISKVKDLLIKFVKNGLGFLSSRLTNSLNTIVGSIHTTAYNHTKGTQKTKRLFIKNPYTEFHTYTVEYSSEKMDFLLDEQVYLTVQNEHKTDKEWPFDKPQYLLLNVAIGGNWGGKKGIDETIFPVTMEVDYVRVFQKN